MLHFSHRYNVLVVARLKLSCHCSWQMRAFQWHGIYPTQVYMCLHICYTHVYIHLYTYVYTHVHTHVYVHVHTHVCMQDLRLTVCKPTHMCMHASNSSCQITASASNMPRMTGLRWKESSCFLSQSHFPLAHALLGPLTAMADARRATHMSRRIVEED